LAALRFAAASSSFKMNRTLYSPSGAPLRILPSWSVSRSNVPSGLISPLALTFGSATETASMVEPPSAETSAPVSSTFPSTLCNFGPRSQPTRSSNAKGMTIFFMGVFR
jgi:hypothetical protein